MLKYDPSGNKFLFKPALEKNERPLISGVNLNTDNYYPTIKRETENANLVPLAYGYYDRTTGQVTGATKYITLVRATTGIYRITVGNGFLGTFRPTVIVTGAERVFMTSSASTSGNTIDIDAYTIGGAHVDASFQFVIYNR